MLACKRWRFSDAEITAQALRATEAQVAAIQAGCRRFAPILAFGTDPRQCAYYVTTRFPMSVRQLIEARNDIGADFLERLCTDVIEGLAELWEKCGRLHGKLGIGNILLDSSDPQKFRVFLTDLAPEAGHLTVADDLFELGRVVCQLVARRRIPALHPPIERTKDWDKLKETADGWLNFCNLLLDRRRHQSPDVLRHILKMARSVNSGGRGRRRFGAGTFATVAVLLLAGAGGWWCWTHWFEPPPSPELVQSVEETIQKFVPPAAETVLERSGWLGLKRRLASVKTDAHKTLESERASLEVKVQTIRELKKMAGDYDKLMTRWREIGELSATIGKGDSPSPDTHEIENLSEKISQADDFETALRSADAVKKRLQELANSR